MIWREPTNHVTDCYFCMTKVRGFSKKNKHKIAYPSPPSAMRPVPHSDGIPVPDPPATLHESESSSESSQSHSYHDNEYTCSDEHDMSPKLLSQELDDLVRDLNLTKESAVLLGSRLQERHLLTSGTKFAWYKHREQQFVNFFTAEAKLLFCNNVQGLVTGLGAEYDPTFYRFVKEES